MADLMFGLNVSTAAGPGADPVADARRAEELGFDFVSANDHLHGRDARFETWTMLSWIAAQTSRIRVATRVLGVPYRNPAVLAKMAETLDRLSGGRLILGLGGGAVDDEFRAFGFDVRSPRDKVAGLEDAVTVIRGLWSEPSFSFEGRLYRTVGAEVEPKPEHHIPIWLGTFGKRGLAVTGRLADGWIPSLGYAPPGGIEGMHERVLAAAREAGRDEQTISCVYNLVFLVDEHAEPSPEIVAGPPAAVVEQLLGFARIGFTGLNFIPGGPEPVQQVERLALEVLPDIRAALAR